MSQRLYLQYGREDYHPSARAAAPAEPPSKMAEIQSYVNMLIENNRAYSEEINGLRKENSDTRGQLQVMMGDMVKIKQAHQEQMATTKQEYNKEVGGLIQELKDILHKKEQMEHSYKALLEELSYQSESDKKARGAHLSDIERNYESKIKILNDRIQDQCRELEKNHKQHSDNKLRLTQQIDELRYENGELRKQNTDLKQGERYLQGEVGRLGGLVKAAGREKEETGVNILKMEQEKNQHIIEMKQNISLLRQELNQQCDNVDRLQVSLLAKEKDLQAALQRLEHESRQCQEFQDLHRHASLQLQQCEGELDALRAQHSHLSDYSSREIKRLTEINRMLETDNAKLAAEKNDLEIEVSTKQQEIHSLIQSTEALEREVHMGLEQLGRAEDQNVELKKQEALLKDEAETLSLEVRNERERAMLQQNRMMTLEQLLEKEKKRVQYADTDREVVVSQLYSRDSDAARKYEAEIQDILMRNERERGDLIEKFEAEKERLIRMYEKALREKELTFKEKLRVMESDIRELSAGALTDR